jgi:hypothetical protein
MSSSFHPILALYGVYRGGGGDIVRFLMGTHPWIYFSLLGVAIALTIWWKYRKKIQMKTLPTRRLTRFSRSLTARLVAWHLSQFEDQEGALAALWIGTICKLVVPGTML